MDYEKAYKAVLKTATQWIKDGCTDKEKICLECVFPQLRESKDERIIREMLEYFTVTRQSDFCSHPERQVWITWLEKQKEPHYTKRNALFDKCVENCDPEVMKEVSNKVDEMLGKEQKSPVWNSPVMTHEMIMEEQKPAEWSEEDERHLIWLCRIIHNRVVNKELSLAEESELGKWIDKWINHEPQPVQKWDEFDEDCLKRAIWYVENPAPSVVKDTNLVLWLKSLRPQSHKEIYQAAKRDLAIKFMNYLDENRPNGKMSLSNGECENIDKAFKENDWAKILRYAEKYGKEN